MSLSSQHLRRKPFICVNTNVHISAQETAMANITLTIPDQLKKEIQKHKEVNWSAVVRRAMTEHLTKLSIADHIAAKSKLTKKDVEELDKLVKKGIAKAHGLAA